MNNEIAHSCLLFNGLFTEFTCIAPKLPISKPKPHMSLDKAAANGSWCSITAPRRQAAQKWVSMPVEMCRACDPLQKKSTGSQ